MNLNELFNTLAADGSRNFKIDLLNKYRDNDTLKKVVFLALDPFTNFYIRKIPPYSNGDLNLDLSKALEMLGDLSQRTFTGNAGINHLTNILANVTPDDAKVIERIIEKDLKCGVSIATANAVWPNLIADYPCMLCSPHDEKLVSKIKFPAYVQMKMDGMRFNAIVKNGSVEFRSRNGKQLDLLGNLEQEFVKLSDGSDVVFDGELLVMMNGDYQFADRQTGNGILNKANKGTISDTEASLVHASVWDMIPYGDFINGECGIKYKDRWSELEKKVSSQSSKGKRIWSVYHKEVTSVDEANAIFQELLAENHEGIILKSKDGIWENKRSKSQIKFKAELDCDLKIVGVVEGTGKYKGMLGALQCESADGVVAVEVGSGFSDEQRKNLMNESIVGKIVAVKYNARIKNKKGENSLFLPVFLEVREDKTTADDSKVIK